MIELFPEHPIASWVSNFFFLLTIVLLLISLTLGAIVQAYEAEVSEEVERMSVHFRRTFLISLGISISILVFLVVYPLDILSFFFIGAVLVISPFHIVKFLRRKSKQ